SKEAPRGGEAEVVVEALGDEGDGLARHRGARVVVPGALPGERHRVRLAGAQGGTVRATSLERHGGGERAPPACRHFGRCGGCATQHVPADAEAAWRVERVRRALARRGLEADVVLGHRSPLGARRRVRLVVAGGGAGLRLGYRERRSHRVVDVAVCPIARPELVAAFAPLRRLLAELAAPPAEIALTAFAEGLEVVLLGGEPPGLADRERLAAWAEAHDVARLAVADTAAGSVEPLAVRRPPVLSWPALVVAPPPLAFLQATADAEAFLQRAVAAAVAGVPRVLDLFAGVGTLSAAARDAGARVDAVERDPAAAAALAGARPALAVAVRDLERRPPTAPELAGVDAVILDPPRRGAAPVAEALAANRVPRVVHVACSPVSFARDAATLVAGGYRLDRVDVVDQFRFSPAVELVAVFARD
ncbi:MAG: class I SAM-dependent RNA methyltransferase, partial [Alphaproteobacteria bacterium]|nr:class I SAM-dependent RNA methyltransferase [Alphaproteobacteria bacterium]